MLQNMSPRRKNICFEAAESVCYVERYFLLVIRDCEMEILYDSICSVNLSEGLSFILLRKCYEFRPFFTTAF